MEEALLPHTHHSPRSFVVRFGLRRRPFLDEGEDCLIVHSLTRSLGGVSGAKVGRFSSLWLDIR